MYWSVPKVWEGGTAVIIGGGPSILKQFSVPKEVIASVYEGKSSPEVYSTYLSELHNKHVIAVNMAYKLGPWIDIVFFGDDGFWTSQKQDLVRCKRLRVTCALGIQPDKRLKFLKRDNKSVTQKKNGISNIPSSICWNNNSGAAAINLAVHLGVKRIILLGFDMSLDVEQNQHWHKFYSGNVKTIDNTFRKHLEGFPAIAEDAKLLGVEIINANPESKIEAFPKMNYKDILL